MAAYARGAKHARGAVIGQDIFESGANFLAGRPDTRLDSARDNPAELHIENAGETVLMLPACGHLRICHLRSSEEHLTASQQAAIQKIHRHRCILLRHTGLLPADSDYRMFSYKHYGSLPGLDIAFLLDGAAYHTDRDTVDRLRPGTLQVIYL